MKTPDDNSFTNFGNLDNLDPAVRSELGQGQRRQTEARLPKSERARKRKERERAEARKAKRLLLDLPVDLKKRLEKLAKREGVPISQLVAFLLFEPVLLLEQKKFDTWVYRLSSGCPKYESTLDLKRKFEDVSRKLEL